MSAQLTISKYFSLINLLLNKHYCCCCSVTKLCPPLQPTDCSTTGFPVLHYLLEFAQIHVHWFIRWCYPTISSSVAPFTSCPQFFLASESFLVSQPFASGGQHIGVSASASVLPVNIQDWFPLGLAGLIFLESKGLSRVFSSTRVWKLQFFCTLSSLWSNPHIHLK